MLNQVKYFQAVVRCNSFSKAAEECYISQSAVSQQVKALERELGVTLLKREKRRFSLTPAGEHFYRQSLLLTADLERLCRETLQIARGDDFTFRIGCSKGYGGSEFQHAVAEFAGKHPNVPIDIKTGSHEDLYEMLRAGNADLILNDQRRAFSDKYVNLILSAFDSQIEISAKNPISDMGYVNASDLRRTRCILIASEAQRENEQNYYREIYGIISPVIFAENIEDARLMVVAGKGYLPVEGGSLPPEYAESISRLPLCHNKTPIRRNYCAFWKAENEGYYTEEFAEILKAQFKNSK